MLKAVRLLGRLFLLVAWGRTTQRLLPLRVAALATSGSRRRSSNTNRIQPLHKRSFDELLIVENSIVQSPSHHTKQQNDRFDYLLGSDESGTGCIAGPVVAVSCCVLRLDSKMQNQGFIPLESVRDCKALSSAECRAIYEHVTTSAMHQYAWSVVVKNATEIDNSVSIQHCIQEAFVESIRGVQSEIHRIGLLQPYIPIIHPPRFYSIVDGDKSPTAKLLGEHIVTRPWNNADTTVYTVALASCLARAVRENIVNSYKHQFPQYEFSEHGGYPSRLHIERLHRYGPISGVHRISCKPVGRRLTMGLSPIIKDALIIDPFNTSTNLGTAKIPDKILNRGRDSMDRLSFLKATSASTILVSNIASQKPVYAITSNPQTGIALPDIGEIQAAVPNSWTDVDDPFVENSDVFARLDNSADSLFYKEPRFVEHVDAQAVRLLTDYIGSIVIQNDRVRSTSFALLDLCSSWTSHIPEDALPKQSRVVGLGMNAQEMKNNPVLTEWMVQDLNDRPILPFDNDSFDTVLLQLSIDYLTQPLIVCREIYRVLRHGGSVHILFSNRLFLTKAIAGWTGKDDVDHAYWVASYLHFCGAPFSNIKGEDLSVRNKQKRIVGDPLYVVVAVKPSVNHAAW